MLNLILYRGKNFISLALVINVFLRIIVMVQGNAVQCGTVSFQRELIIGGDAVLRDEWPFIAALYYSESFKYFCGGTIISNKHVLTAAHCIQEKFAKVGLLPDAITVRVGGYNLTSSNESGVVDRNVTQIHMHPDWNVSEERYDADIAVLVLNKNITFSINIRPVCMPTDDVNIEGMKGVVVGWGITENGTAEGIPRKTEITALTDSYCYRQDNVIARYSSERSFCGVGDGTPNKGDSGDGFFVITGSVWVQYGTVSIVRTNATGHVVPGLFAAYTKLTSLKSWIAETVKQSGSLVSEATVRINLQCSFGFDGAGLFGCWLFNLNIRQPRFVVNSTNDRSFQKKNIDVEVIVFESGVMLFLPDNIGSIFKKLKYLFVGKLSSVSLGTKRIFRSNFQSLEHLEDIRFFNNEIEELDEDFLWDLSKLKSFQLEKSKLKSLNATTFSRNSKLTTLYVRSSELRTLPRNLFANNLLLEDVAFDSNFIEALDDGTFDQNPYLKLVSFQRNRLESLSNNLFRNNSKLKFVDFSHNVIKSIGEQTFKINSKLKTPSIESNGLERIDFSNILLELMFERLFETNVRAREIDLSSNQLHTLPRYLFRNILLLDAVSLGKNFFETIDEKLFEMNISLRNISLKSNRCKELPERLFKSNSFLELVDVRSNFLETIYEHTFETNGRLVEVRFGNNNLTSVPPKLFTNNFLLQTVDFANNFLTKIDVRIFQMNSNLRNVFLSSNLLDSVPSNLFRNNSLLEIVDLSNNRIETIDENIFVANQGLRKIYLKKNQLDWLPRRLFQGNTDLEHIDLRGNQLKAIEIVFTELKRVDYINLFENVCIDAVFYSVGQEYSFNKLMRSVTEIQNLINANCTLYHFIPI